MIKDIQEQKDICMPTLYQTKRRNAIKQKGSDKLDLTRPQTEKEKMAFFNQAEKKLLDFIAKEEARKFPDEDKILSAENKLQEVRKSKQRFNER